MNHLPESQQDRVLQALLERERILENRVNEEDLRYSGLKDLDTLLELVAAKFEIANHLLARFNPTRPDHSEQGSAAQLIRRKSTDAVNLLEELRTMNISEDQKDLVTEAEAYTKVRDHFQAFILAGGGVFFESKIDRETKS